MKIQQRMMQTAPAGWSRRGKLRWTCRTWSGAASLRGPGQRVRPAVLVIRDYKTKAELAWYAINGPEIKHLSKLTWRKALRAKPFKNIGTGDQSGGFLHLSKGQQIRFSVYYDDEEYKSPVLKP